MFARRKSESDLAVPGGPSSPLNATHEDAVAYDQGDPRFIEHEVRLICTPRVPVAQAIGPASRMSP